MVDDALAVLAAQVGAWNAGDMDGYCDRCAPDIYYLSAAGICHGRDALRARYQSAYPDRAAMGRLSVEVVSASAFGDQVTVVARWSIVGDSPHTGAALLVLALGDDGWALTHDATIATQ
jgi:ketosteroid isomerase-like protein